MKFIKWQLLSVYEQQRELLTERALCKDEEVTPKLQEKPEDFCILKIFITNRNRTDLSNNLQL